MLAGFIEGGSASVFLRVMLYHATTGQGLTGLTSASSGLIISTITNNEATATAYTVTGSTIEDISVIGTYAAPTATKCRFEAVDATNHPGMYEIHLADARWAVADAQEMHISIQGASNLLQRDLTYVMDSVTLAEISAQLLADGFVKQTYLDTRSLPKDDYATDSDLDAIGDEIGEQSTTLAVVKGKTDQLTFTQTNELDVNIHSVNDGPVGGVGSSGTPWGPA